MTGKMNTAGIKSVAAWLALLALVLQTVVPFGQILQAAEADDVIYICTPSGIVAFNPDGPAEENHEDMAECQVCTAGLFGSGFLTPEVSVRLPALQQTSQTVSSYQIWTDNATSGALPPRGPPATA